MSHFKTECCKQNTKNYPFFFFISLFHLKTVFLDKSNSARKIVLKNWNSKRRHIIHMKIDTSFEYHIFL